MNSPYNGRFRVSQQFKGDSHDGLDLVGIDSKEIFSTVNGVVEKSGYENEENEKQGFGLYVRIRQENSTDRYYFGHLSQTFVATGQFVKIGDKIGIEGSTGNSTGSHCHYCARGNGSKSQIRDICAISGISNAIGEYNDTSKAILKKTVSQLADEVIKGLWGNGEERKTRLNNAGYSYNLVQAEVNRLLSNAPAKKSNTEIADEVIKGLWGNGEERKARLNSAGYNASEIQRIVNEKLR